MCIRDRQFAGRTDGRGRPIYTGPSFLVINPGDEIAWKEILQGIDLAKNNALRVGTQGLQTLVMNPYVPAGKWWLFAAPGTLPAVRVYHLEGYQTPQVFREASNTETLSGGEVALAGDFDNGMIRFKSESYIGGRVDNPSAQVGIGDQNGLYYGGD